MRCAVVSLATGEVLNIIVADPGDPAQDGCVLVALEDGQPCDIGWLMVGLEFVDPNPPPEPEPDPEMT